MALAETQELAAHLSLRDGLTQGVRKAQGALKGLDQATARTQKSLKKTGDNLTKFGKLIAVGAAGAAIASVKLAGDFEASLRTINTIAREDAAGLKQIGDSIRKVARDTGTPLEELTQGYYDLLSAGIQAKDATNVLTAANKLAIGGLASTAETIDLLTTAINTYGGDASKAAQYADYFAKSVERGKVTAAQIAQTFATVGSIAQTSGIEIEELAAAYAQLTAKGVPAAEVATQIRSAIVALTRRTTDLEKLEKKTGKSYLAIAGKQGLVVALEQLRKDAQKAGIPLIDLLGRVEGLSFTLNTTGTNLESYNENLRSMADSSGTAAEQMSERQQGLNYQLARLKAIAKDAGITIGTALLPKITPLVERLNNFLSANQDKIAKFGDDLASAFERVSDAIQQVDWRPFIDGLRTTAAVAQKAVEMFMGLPDNVKSLILAAAAVNKVTGGLITSVTKDLAGIGLKLFLDKGQTPANPIWVASVNGGVGGGGLPGGKTGLLSNLGPIIGGATAIAAMQEVARTGAAAGASALSGDPRVGQVMNALPAPTLGTVDVFNPIDRLMRALQGDFRSPLERFQDETRALTAATEDATADTAEGNRLARQATEANTAAQMRLAKAMSTMSKDDTAAARHSGVTLVGEALRKLRAEVTKLTHGDRVNFLGKGTTQGQIKTADYLAHQFEKSQKPFYRDMGNAQRTLKDLKALQQRFIAHGDTKSADKIGADIERMQTVIARNVRANEIASKLAGHEAASAIKDKDLSVTVKVPVTSVATTVINGRVFESTVNRQSILVRPGQAAVAS